jgi:nucleoside-diphosphate-sugar epimerase
MWLEAQSNKLAISNVILEHLYGPGDRMPKFVPTMIEAARRGELSNLKRTAGEQTRDWLFIEDAVSAFVLVLEQALGEGPGYSEFSAGTGSVVSVREFVEVLASVFGQTPPIFGSRPYGDGEIWESCADLSRLAKLGYQPKFSIRRGLERCRDD